MWFTVKEDKPDIGTVIFKADDYYERLQHITGMWNDNKFLFYEMENMLQETPFQFEKPLDCDNVFNVQDITNVPLLRAYIEKVGREDAFGLDGRVLDFMWDLHRLYVKKMWEFGHAINWMSKKEYTLLDNHEKWLKMRRALEDLQAENKFEEEEVRRKKRQLKPARIIHYSRIEALPFWSKKTKTRDDAKGRAKGKKKGRLSREESKKFTDVLGAPAFQTEKEEDRKPKYKKLKPYQIKKEEENPFAWDFAGTRLYDRKHVREAGKHLEFSRLYHKLAKALRFSKHEPVDWRSITLEEVDKHRYPNDCWMAIKGRVFDVTEFIPTHPGGPVIRQGTGTDATELFVAVHPFVVFYEHLKGKQIGTLPDFVEHYHTEWEPPAYFNIYRTIKEWMFRPKNRFAKFVPKVKFKQDDTYYVFIVSFPKTLKSHEEDWTMAIVHSFTVTVIKFIDAPYVWYGGFDLRTRVIDDSVYKWFSDDYNTMHLKIAKTFKVHVNRPIRDWRQDNGLFLSSYALRDMFTASIVVKENIAEGGVKLYGITLGMNKCLGCPIGCYVNLRILDELRPYAPVCLPEEFEDKYHVESGDFLTLFFIIREFKDGDFTSMLHYLSVRKTVVGVELYVSPPMSNFHAEFLYSDMEMMLLVAGGTGISVMTRIIQDYVLNKDKMKGLAVCLFFVVQHREEIIWKETWERIRDQYEWFHFFCSLTRVYRYTVEPVADTKKPVIASVMTVEEIKRVLMEQRQNKKKNVVTPMEIDETEPFELFGHPTIKKMDHIFDNIPRAREYEKHKAIVCGPYGFNKSIGRLLKEFGKHKEENIHYFAG